MEITGGVNVGDAGEGAMEGGGELKSIAGGGAASTLGAGVAAGDLEVFFPLLVVEDFVA